MPKAISHWELALGQNPNLVIVLNNLAVALTEQDASNVPRSLEMIDKALKIVGGNDAELFDSRGTVLLASGNAKESITWFEKAISVDPKRPSTREGIIKAAEKAELPELAEIHRVALAELTDQLAKEAEAKKLEEAANAVLNPTTKPSEPNPTQTPIPAAKPIPVAAPIEGLPPSAELIDPLADEPPLQNAGTSEGADEQGTDPLDAESSTNAKADLILGPGTEPESTVPVGGGDDDAAPASKPDDGKDGL
jgi:tetratricopeptide (TPR) repeat protein